LRAKCVASLGKLKLPDGALLTAFAKDDKADVRSAVVGALAANAKAEAIPALTAFLDDSEVEIRRKAIGALGNLKASASIPALIEAERRPETRMDAIAALTRMPDARAIDVYLDGLAEKNPAVRDTCAKAISALKPQSASLVSERIQVAKVPPAMADELRKIFGNQFIAQSADVSPERYDAFASAHTGNLQHGREIFVDQNGIGCIRCHFLQGKGGDMGPDLTHIGANYTRAELIESVLYPSKKILGDYQQFTLEMKNGDTLFGSVRNETADSLVIVDAEGKKHPVTKSEIVNRVKSELSPMPPGLQAALSLQDFADLISFLQSLK
jgi:putative heme-binding domain-containing protein